ncbi:MAG: helix-turn-helix transcriptional regulator [Labilibaculum sp.]|nr:S24 family peptidase [Labilibaculum sp.]MBI9058392.1 helix-turn-helix transcriptional regulator [Labilibaculum sp.]
MIKTRVLEHIAKLSISKNKFYNLTGIPNGTLDKKSGISEMFLEKYFSVFPEVNPTWLLTGKGEMLCSVEEKNVNDLIIEEESLGAVPFWNLHVSAGHSVTEVIGQSKPNGYIKGLPGADIAENILPVLGASMEPEVSNGAIIGVRVIHNWESLNTERIYMIITKDDRMIKRIEYDNENEDILWCVSPNYPKFKIFKADIVEIQRVCFVYNPK